MSLDFNQSLVHSSLEAQGVLIEHVLDSEVYIANYQAKTELLIDIANSSSSFPAGWIASDKYLAKAFLQSAGIPTPKGHFFTSTNIEDAITFAEENGWPVVLKPTNGTHGDFVFPMIESSQELRKKIKYFLAHRGTNSYFLIEKHIFGEEYRIFYAKDENIAVVHRKPAQVIGDGTHTLSNLIQIENYNRLNPRTNCLCAIKLDAVLFDSLEKRQLSLEYIPAEGEVVILRPSTNVSMGGSCDDVTDSVHRSILSLCKKVLRSIPGLALVGIDLICQDISKPLNRQVYAVCEVNAIPGLSLHTLPGTGKSRDVASIVARQILHNIK